MAHNIYNDGTKDCMFVVGKREDAWHLLGQRCENAVSWEQAVELAGLNWKVLKQRNYARNPEGKVYDDCEPVPEQLAEYANRLDYTTADLQTDPKLRTRLARELAEEAGISHMTPEQQQAWWDGKL